jgi:ribonuclease E
MLEIERQDNESGDGRNEVADQNESQGRGLLRRARRAVTRPAGPPSTEPAAQPAHEPAPAPAGDPAETPRAEKAPTRTRSARTQPAATSAAGEPAQHAAATSAAAAASDTGGTAAGAADPAQPGEDGEKQPAKAARQTSSRTRTSRSRTTKARADGDDTPAGPEEHGPAGGSESERPVSSEPPAPDGRQAPPQVAFQPPLVIFQPPEIAPARPAASRPERPQPAAAAQAEGEDSADSEKDETAGGTAASKRRRRGGRGRGKGGGEGTDGAEVAAAAEPASKQAAVAADGESDDDDADESTASARRRRRRRRSGTGGEGDGQAGDGSADDPPNTVVHVRSPRSAADTDVRSVKGSTRLEAKRQRRREGRESGRRRPPIITESEFLARREAVERVMVVRQHGDRTQIAVLEDGVLVEHYVDKASHQSYVGNVYLGKVQNVLPSMEAAFVDIGKGRNAVLYAGEVNFDASGLEGESKRIESALKSGQSILVQVTKDPIGHKGARLTSQVSLPGRYLVYVPGASMTGISRKLPDTERTRLKQILKQVMPENAGVIVRTAAEGASEEELARDVARLSAQWEAIEKKAKTASAPDLLYSEPDLTLRVVRDIFNEDFTSLVIASETEWDLVDEYVRYVAPHLADRMQRWEDDKDVFGAYRIDEQLAKALERKVWLPSGGSLVIDHTEAMTVIDVNTGKFTGQGGNLEQTVTRNNLEAAEEIVRQLRLRDLGGIIVIDFIDMVLESNRELVLRRLLECLARDRTKHQVAEVTSLGLVQMTRKRVGSGLLEAFSVSCEHCNGRGVITSMEPVDHTPARGRDGDGHTKENGRGRNGPAQVARSTAARAGQGKGATRVAADGPGADGSDADPAEGNGVPKDSAANAGGAKRSSRSRASRASGPPSSAATGGPAESAAADPTGEPVADDQQQADASPRRSRSGRSRRSPQKAQNANGDGSDPGGERQQAEVQAGGREGESASS